MTAWSLDRPKGQEIMALQHRVHPVFGVQFHPESIATEGGRALLANFLRISAQVPTPGLTGAT
jgi:anthranilate synthase component 2